LGHEDKKIDRIGVNMSRVTTEHNDPISVKQPLQYCESR
jgi:hypothetical protein